MLSEVTSYYQQAKWVQRIADKYRALDVGADVYNLKPEGKWEQAKAIAKAYFKDFDDPRDRAAWTYGLEHF